jgi:endonuclease/exonuclease/phosphatase (EEP) superfamily protein YafD
MTMSATTAPTVPIPPPPQRRRRTGRYVLAALGTVIVAVGALPDLVGLDHHSPFSQIVAFRPWILLGIAVLVLVTAWPRRTRPLAAGLLAVLVVGATMVLPRAIADPLPAGGGKQLTVLSFNAKVGMADVDAFAELVREKRPDLVAMVEAGGDFADDVESAVEKDGYRLTSSRPDKRDWSNPVAVLVNEKLGNVTTKVDQDTAWYPSIEVTGGALGKLHFVAYHARSPRPGDVQEWRDDLGLLPRWCTAQAPTIVAGDFNATLDHSPLRSNMAGCSDAAAQRGDGLIPTWGPSDGRRVFGPQIDHIMSTQGIAAESFEAHDIRGSDHRAIVATLEIPS